MRELAAAALKQRHGRQGPSRIAGEGEAGEGDTEEMEREGEHEESMEGGQGMGELAAAGQGGASDSAQREGEAQDLEGKQQDAEKEAAERLPGLRAQQTSSSMASLASRLVAMEAVVKAREEREREKGEEETLVANQQEEEEDDDDDEETKACRNLFKGLVFYLAREVGSYSQFFTRLWRCYLPLLHVASPLIVPLPALATEIAYPAPGSLKLSRRQICSFRIRGKRRVTTRTGPRTVSNCSGCMSHACQPRVCRYCLRSPPLISLLDSRLQVPREVLMFVIRSFGGKVSWEGEEAPVAEDDESITHQV